ncbi:deoxyribonuclease-1-like protein [Flavobacterium sp. W4I14]|nr:deoxyribonuclease-1-like protein [Flavobacterium sp. W4I14]
MSQKSHTIRSAALIIIFSVFSFNGFAHSQLSVISWNLKDLGISKSDAEIGMIARTLNPYDVVAVQEVVAGPDGPKAVARLADALNRKGVKWEYEISAVTSGSSAHKAERYAFFWQSAKVSRIGKGWLEDRFGLEIEREPFYGRFRVGETTITLVNFHAITRSKQPETEVKYFKFLPARYPVDNLIFCGDFNLPQSHSVFNPLKSMGFRSALVKQKTTLRQRCIGDGCLASEFDNFYYDSAKLSLKVAGVIHFYRLLPDIAKARMVSDHIPIFAVYQL